MPRAVWGVLLLALSCGRTAAPPAAIAPSPTPTVSAIWSVESARAGSRDVRLRFVMAACAVVQHVDVAESADRVVVTLDVGGRGGKDCTEPLVRHRDVHLKAPLGTRALYDGGVAPPALVRP